MKYIRGFLMAWGCFCWIPCPYKKWNEEDRPYMLAMLPLLGTFMGIIVSAAWLLLDLLGAGPFLTAVLVTAIYFLMTGFIHLDGFMDCCDAVLPRHPDPERRREILKDPHNGAFGIISLVLMMAVFIASIYEIAERTYQEPDLVYWGYVMIFPMILTVSRWMSVRDVIKEKPMDTSQYVQMSERGRQGLIPATIVGLVVIAVIIGLDILFNMRFDDRYSMGRVMVAAGFVMLAAVITGSKDRKVLGGMSGDISGHMIVTGEMFGLLAAALVMYL